MPSAIIPVKVKIDKDDVIYRNLVVNTVIGGHHHFSFTWNIGKIKNDQSFQLSVIKNNIGKNVSIQFDDNKFIGIITSISVEDINSATQAFIVSGQSLSIIIDATPECASYNKKSLSDIVKGSLDGVPSNVLEQKIKPVNTETHHYITQYNETDFQFLQRMSTRFGEWLYMDGKTLVFGSPGNSTATLDAAADIKNFVLQGNLQSTKHGFKAYDASKGENINKEASALESLGNDFADAVASKSKEVYSRTTGRGMHSFNAVNKGMIESIAKLQTSQKTTQTLTVRGESKHPALKAGSKFKIKTAGGTYEYVATSVVHYSNQTGHYENSFSAVAGGSTVPPYTNPNIFRRADSQNALVKENHDSDGLGRIKVQFVWQRSAEITPWLRISSPHGGKSKGMHFIPEKGEEVIVDFEGGDVDKPFVAGTVYSGSASISYSNAENDLKVIQTRSGHVIELNDKDGAETITIKDKNNNTIEINTAEDSINLTANSSINLNATTINMMASAGITMNAGAAIEGAAGTMVTFGAGVSSSFTSAKDTVILAGKMLSASGGKNAKFASGSGAVVELDAKGEAKFNSTKKMDISSKESTITGSSKATLKSSQTFVEGSSKAVVKGSQVDIS